MPNDLADTLRPPGVWTFLDALSASEAADAARRIEALGYSALWHPETTGRDPLALIAHLAAATSTLVLASGIANIYTRHPGLMKQAQMTLAEQSGGRFVGGIGVSHAPLVEGLRGLTYEKPLTAMRTYLDGMDGSPYDGPAGPSGDAAPVVLAALGPKMLELARDRAAGAHPYFTTPEHTRRAREILGPDKLLCVEQKVILTTDESAAREAAIKQTARYGRMPNYRNNWKRLGYTEEQIADNDPAFVDDLIAWGDVDALQSRIDAHYAAGATHVCIQPVSVDGRPTPDMDVLEALAPGRRGA